MPNCFSLTRKGEKEPTNLNRVDEELCQHLEVDVHETRFVAGWYDIFGLAMALGVHIGEEKMDEIAGEDKHLRKILAYLRENFTDDAWYEHK